MEKAKSLLALMLTYTCNIVLYQNMLVFHGNDGDLLREKYVMHCQGPKSTTSKSKSCSRFPNSLQFVIDTRKKSYAQLKPTDNGRLTA